MKQVSWRRIAAAVCALGTIVGLSACSAPPPASLTSDKGASTGNGGPPLPVGELCGTGR